MTSPAAVVPVDDDLVERLRAIRDECSIGYRETIEEAIAVLSAAPPVQMEAVAWRVGVPNNEYATLHEDVAEIARQHGYEITPLYASPVPSSERDDIIEMCAKWHDEVAATALKQAKSAESGGHESIARHQYAVCGSHEASAAYFRSLKSQPAQESGEGSV